jgi:hypothetical protein
LRLAAELCCVLQEHLASQRSDVAAARRTRREPGHGVE